MQFDLGNFDITGEYVKGKENMGPDALSKIERSSEKPRCITSNSPSLIQIEQNRKRQH